MNGGTEGVELSPAVVSAVEIAEASGDQTFDYSWKSWYRDLSDEDRDAQLEKLSAERDEKVGAILTPQQKTAFTQKQGKVFDFSGGSNPPSGTAAPAAVASTTPTAPSATRHCRQRHRSG